VCSQACVRDTCTSLTAYEVVKSSLTKWKKCHDFGLAAGVMSCVIALMDVSVLHVGGAAIAQTSSSSMGGTFGRLKSEGASL
jgi:hypothetical protein